MLRLSKLIWMKGLISTWYTAMLHVCHHDFISLRWFYGGKNGNGETSWDGIAIMQGEMMAWTRERGTEVMRSG